MSSDLKFKKLIFFNGKVKIEGNELSWKPGLFGDEESFRFDEVVAVVPMKKWCWIHHRLQFAVRGRDYLDLKIKVTKKMAKNFLQFLKEKESPVYTKLKGGLTNETDKNMNFIDPQDPQFLSDNASIWEYEDSFYLVGQGEYPVLVWIPFYYKHFNEEVVKDYLFFNRSGKNIYFGGKEDQLRVFKLKPELIDYIKNRFLDWGAKFGVKEGKEFKNSFSFKNGILSLFGFGRKETITISDENVHFTTKKRKSEDTIILPLEEVFFHRVEKKLFNASIEIYGTQNISPKLKFSKKTAKELKTNLEKVQKAGTSHVARKYVFYTFMGGFIKRNKFGNISLVKDYILLTPPKKDRKKGDADFMKVNFDDIYGYYFKKPWLFSWKKNGILIVGDSNIRSDQSGKWKHIYVRGYNNMNEVIQSMEKNNVNKNRLYSNKDLKKMYKSEFSKKK